MSFGGGLSTENDNIRFGLDTQIARDLNNRNTTLSAGLARSDDSVKPIGPDALVGSLSTVELTPDLTALIGELSYKFGR